MAEPNAEMFMFHAIESRIQVTTLTVTFTDMHSGVGRFSRAWASKCENDFLETLKFGVRDLSVMPWIKKSYVVYSKFYSQSCIF